MRDDELKKINSLREKMQEFNYEHGDNLYVKYNNMSWGVSDVDFWLVGNAPCYDDMMKIANLLWKELRK